MSIFSNEQALNIVRLRHSKESGVPGQLDDMVKIKYEASSRALYTSSRTYGPELVSSKVGGISTTGFPICIQLVVLFTTTASSHFTCLLEPCLNL